jgi:hypothetical protein
MAKLIPPGLAISPFLRDLSRVAATAGGRKDAGTVCLAAWVTRPAADFAGVSECLALRHFGGAARADELCRAARLGDLSSGGRVS